ncbi:hypothetical protein BVRB_2g046980 [Beta vulgaris subsp. vulgaris]|uniref:Uncharacterized protein n=1 Tax=Beta vulgaris subsp. vulgaris TaxID=3555 RepID=A0A0J8BCX9_BETVV|nr:protein LIKE EARLY STARVATION, chloroplastic isoform X2 [Beta vulgaris subsp. vulgaris]KMS99199.1 hypothetical protein BVRB_2g046980 [Beta vulgaris subsp. vulgaris]
MASSYLRNHLTIARSPNDSTHGILQTGQSTQIAVKSRRRRTNIRDFRISASNGSSSNGDSYLNMWKKAVKREQKEIEFQKIAQNLPAIDEENPEVLERKSFEFQKILEVSKEERDKVQRMQVIDRAAAAIAAARALLKDKKVNTLANAASLASSRVQADSNRVSSLEIEDGGTDSRNLYKHQPRIYGEGPPGPDFWSWTPPPEDDSIQSDVSNAERAPKTSVNLCPSNEVMEKERAAEILSIPLESTYLERNLLPPFQSLMDVHNVVAPETTQDVPVTKEEIGSQFSAHAAEAAQALHEVEGKPSYGVNRDGSRWWKETGVERRPDGVVCRWTLNRGVTADGVVEWEEKYWEAADEFEYKELGSEKSGRDAMGNVWHEYWKETMWQEHGLLHMEKTADKWGKNAKGDEWQEKWLELYDATGKAEKWAHKWCSIDPTTQLQAGHAHVWHERWGENYDGQGASIKYTDRWAERYEGDDWVKWGDKWDENFDLNGHGVKQGETWWQGKCGDQWNRTWGEKHNGSGWLHKYGKSSNGEHWDTHVQEGTWYERFPHFGFMHCFENSPQLREVTKPSET